MLGYHSALVAYPGYPLRMPGAQQALNGGELIAIAAGVCIVLIVLVIVGIMISKDEGEKQKLTSARNAEEQLCESAGQWFSKAYQSLETLRLKSTLDINPLRIEFLRSTEMALRFKQIAESTTNDVAKKRAQDEYNKLIEAAKATQEAVAAELLRIATSESVAEIEQIAGDSPVGDLHEALDQFKIQISGQLVADAVLREDLASEIDRLANREINLPSKRLQSGSK